MRFHSDRAHARSFFRKRPRNRWGDYSGISVDPSNETFFWVFNEYALMRSDTPDSSGGDGRWGTAWGRTK